MDWPSLFLLLSLHARRMSFSTSQTATLSVSPTLLHQPWTPCLGPLDSPTLGPSALDPLPSFFHTSCWKGPCGSRDIKKGLLFSILETESVSLERLERLFLPPPLFLAESSRKGFRKGNRTAEKWQHSQVHFKNKIPVTELIGIIQPLGRAFLGQKSFFSVTQHSQGEEGGVTGCTRG